MREISINIGIKGDLHIHYREARETDKLIGYREGVKIKFHYMISLYQGREALNFIKNLLNKENKENIDWIIPNHDRWTFDLDKLKGKFPELSEIEWLKGRVSLKPEIFVDPDEAFGSKGTNITFYIIQEEIGGVEMNKEIPEEIRESIKKFRKDYPVRSDVAFIVMQYGESKAYNDILKIIKETLNKYNISGVIANDKEYHEELYYNVLTYIYGCDFGIAVFERIEEDNFNPNVALEVGYLLALKKPVCLLKDKTLPFLHTDIVGKIYRAFNTRKPKETISKVLIKWMEDKGIIKE